MPILISTAAIVGLGPTIANATSSVPKSSLFILLPPFSITDYLPEDLAWLEGLLSSMYAWNTCLKAQVGDREHPTLLTPATCSATRRQ
jgi:hypothetical protein